MSYYLFLDDVRKPGDVTWVALPDASFEVVRSFEEFVIMISHFGLPEFISFDYDLGDSKTKTGYDCAKWLFAYCFHENKMLPKFEVHSKNPIGKENIEFYLANANKYLYQCEEAQWTISFEVKPSPHKR